MLRFATASPVQHNTYKIFHVSRNVHHVLTALLVQLFLDRLRKGEILQRELALLPKANTELEVFREAVALVPSHHVHVAERPLVRYARTHLVCCKSTASMAAAAVLLEVTS